MPYATSAAFDATSSTTWYCSQPVVPEMGRHCMLSKAAPMVCTVSTRIHSPAQPVTSPAFAHPVMRRRLPAHAPGAFSVIAVPNCDPIAVDDERCKPGPPLQVVDESKPIAYALGVEPARYQDASGSMLALHEPLEGNGTGAGCVGRALTPPSPVPGLLVPPH